MGFAPETELSAVTVFLQGLLSFFSPCILPLLPVYFGYLSAGAARRDADGAMHYERRRVFTRTVLFVLGISCAFFLLGLGMSALGIFLRSHQALFTLAGGIVIVLFGLLQLAVYSQSAAKLAQVPGLSRLLTLFSSERRLSHSAGRVTGSPLSAFLLGFAFSFAWTPCVGPTLSSVLLLAATRDSSREGFALIAVYTLGFILPFLAAGLFTERLLGFFRGRTSFVRRTAQLGALVMLIIGLVMIQNGARRLSGSTQASGAANTARTSASAAADAADTDSSAGGTDQKAAESHRVSDESQPENGAAPNSEGSADAGGRDGALAPASSDDAAVSGRGSNAADSSSSEDDAGAADNLPLAPDFTLSDQNGVTHTLSSYRGKTVFLNFWATWCLPCRAEMPDIQKLYEEFASTVNADDNPDNDVVILSIAAPGYGDETDVAGIASFLAENGYTYPVLMDEGGTQYAPYYISAFPTTFLIRRDGRVEGYVTGGISESSMRKFIAQTQEE